MNDEPVFQEASRTLAIDRARVVRAIVLRRLRGSELVAALEKVAQALGISVRTARRYHDALVREDGRSSALEPKRRGPKKGSRRLDFEREALIEQRLRELYLKPERSSFLRVVEEIRLECRASGLQPPTRRTVKARLDSLDQREVVRRRLGPKAARERFAAVAGKRGVDRALEIVQIDPTRADIVLVDSIERKPYLRPWVTFAIDVATRMVTGMYVTYEPPSALSNALCIDQSVRERRVLDDEGNVLCIWPAFGIPERIHVDNGSDFRSRAFEQACAEWGIELEHRPPGRPHYGGHIERVIGTAMRAVHTLHGTTGASVADRGERKPSAGAAMTLSEFETWLALEICRYHHSEHSVLGCSPMAAWEAGQDAVLRRRPGDADAFRISFLPQEQRVLRRDGIHLFRIRYWSDAFAPMIGRGNTSFTVKYDPRDLSRIWLRTEDGRMIEARYRDLTRPAISLWENSHARRLHREKTGNGSIDETLLFGIVVEQRRLVDGARQQTSREKRSLEVRSAGFVDPDNKSKLRKSEMFAVNTGDPSLPVYEIEDIGPDGSPYRKDRF
ncbi:MAG: Mu transposase C-terminal domain-containing protein [Paracoccaceae bacterium]